MHSLQLDLDEHYRDCAARLLPEPAVNEMDGRWTTEMISSVYQSQLTGARVTFPLKDRRHPLKLEKRKQERGGLPA